LASMHAMELYKRVKLDSFFTCPDGNLVNSKHNYLQKHITPRALMVTLI